jgi:hypothetical protein
MKIVFLNGPPGCGKDTVVQHLVQYLQFTHLKFAAPIKRMVCGLLNEDTKWLEQEKDVPHRTLRRSDGAAIASIDTPRQLLIALSEDLLKQRYGSDFFGLVMNNEISKAAQKLIIISDSGFLDEAYPVVRKWGIGNCMHVRMYRPGCNFTKDSRNYWYIPDLATREVHNNDSIHDLTMTVLYAIIRQWSMREALLKEPQWIK